MENETYVFDDEKNRIQEFAVRFFGGNVRIDETVLPVGQVSTEILNLPKEVLKELFDRGGELADFLTGRFVDPDTKKDAALAKQFQESVNPVQEVLYQIPPYCYMEIDKEPARNIWTSWQKSEPHAFKNIFRPGSPHNRIFRTYIDSIAGACREVFEFKGKVNAMLEVYFEPLQKRNPSEYARAAHDFIEDGRMVDDIDDLFSGKSVFKLQQLRNAQVEYVPMQNPESPEEYIIAERMLFHSIGEFLHMDIFRALICGNAPRRCHNCGTYFLLTQGYNTCYCNNIAPGETERTCRKVGAHKKEADKAGKSPIRVEYDKVYRRLTTRKTRKTITVGEWNKAVALAQEYKDKADRGELSELELKEIYSKM